MYPKFERNILSFLSQRLNLITPAEVATSYMQLTQYKKCISAAIDQENCSKSVRSFNLHTDESLPILITFYCLSSK